jgi:hypothetical protein
MEVIVERPAALDVHNASVMACVRVPGDGQRRAEHVAEFHTTVQGLLALRDWLEAHEVDQVAMEATGVYWKPVWRCSRIASSVCSLTPVTSSRSRAARPTCSTRSGSVSCSRPGCCGRAW